MKLENIQTSARGVELITATGTLDDLLSVAGAAFEGVREYDSYIRRWAGMVNRELGEGESWENLIAEAKTVEGEGMAPKIKLIDEEYFRVQTWTSRRIVEFRPERFGPEGRFRVEFGMGGSWWCAGQILGLIGEETIASSLRDLAHTARLVRNELARITARDQWDTTREPAAFDTSSDEYLQYFEPVAHVEPITPPISAPTPAWKHEVGGE